MSRAELRAMHDWDHTARLLQKIHNMMQTKSSDVITDASLFNPIRVARAEREAAKRAEESDSSEAAFAMLKTAFLKEPG